MTFVFGMERGGFGRRILLLLLVALSCFYIRYYEC